MNIKESFKEALEFDKKRLFFGILFAIIEVVMLVLTGTKTLFIIAYPLVTIAVSIWKIKKNNFLSYLLKVIVLGLFLFGTIVSIQVLSFSMMMKLRKIMVVADAFCILLVAVLVFTIINNARISLIISGFLWNILATVDYFIYDFRGTPLYPIDFIKIGTALNVADNYKLSLSDNLIVGWVFFIIICAGLFAFENFKCKRKILGRTVALVLFIGLLGVCLVISKFVKPQRWINLGAELNGYPVAFVVGLNDLNVEQPEGYDANNVEKIAEKYDDTANNDDKNNSDKKPDIFVIMNESFADFNVLGDNLNTNEEVLPFWNSLNKNVVKGYAYSSVFGGNTANSEYEFLTGNSMAFFPVDSIPYQQYVDAYQYSIVADLKKKGYECNATHPYEATGWSRPQVYPALGFDNITFKEAYTPKHKIRTYISDQDMFEELISRYEKRDKSKPQFTFGVTMQNHGRYDYSGSDFSPSIKLEGYSEDYPKASQYFSLIHETDKAFEYFINYFSKQKDPVVVVMFGDHFPKIEQDFYNEVHGGDFKTLDERLLLQKIPFVVWANYDIETKTDELTSINYLPEYLYDIAGLSKPAYTKAISEIQKTVPIINGKGYYSISKQRFLPLEYAKDKEKKAINDYAQMQYNNVFDNENKNKKLFPDLN